MPDVHSTYPLPDLLLRWKRGELTGDQLGGYILQHVIRQDQRIAQLEKAVGRVKASPPPAGDPISAPGWHESGWENAECGRMTRYSPPFSHPLSCRSHLGFFAIVFHIHRRRRHGPTDQKPDTATNQQRHANAGRIQRHIAEGNADDGQNNAEQTEAEADFERRRKFFNHEFINARNRYSINYTAGLV